jgi:hypothetical protein
VGALTPPVAVGLRALLAVDGSPVLTTLKEFAILLAISFADLNLRDFFVDDNSCSCGA